MTTPAPKAEAPDHELKCWPEPFEAILCGDKRHEYRKDDRGFKVGETLLLSEWSESGGYTGASVEVGITYISRGPAWGIPTGYCVMSISTLRFHALDPRR